MLTEYVDLTEFSFSSLPRTGFYEVLGKRGTGKTTWTKYMLQFTPHAHVGMFVVMCGSETIRESWSEVIHPMYIQGPRVDYLETVVNDRNELIRESRLAGRALKEEEHLTLVLDDVASVRRIMRSNVLAYLASNSRHLHMSIFLLAQYHCQIPAEIRNQNDLIFMLATHDQKTIRRVHAEYASCLDRRAFEHVVSYCTDNYGMLVIDNRSIGSDFDSICFSARISDYNELQFAKLGSQSLHQFIDHWYFDENHPTDQEAVEWTQSQQEKDMVKQIMGNRRIFQDRRGKLVIRTV